MSTRSDPSATLSGETPTFNRDTTSPMLENYLANPPTITERLAFSELPNKTSKAVAERRKNMEKSLNEWQE